MSWEQLLDIYAEAAEEAATEAAETPEGCPQDGTPLEAGPQGELHCRFCGWTDM